MQQIVTMTTESVESVSSTQTIISLISSEDEGSEDFDFTSNTDVIQSRRTAKKLVTLSASSKNNSPH